MQCINSMYLWMFVTQVIFFIPFSQSKDISASKFSRQGVIRKLFRMTERHHVRYDHNFVFPPFFWKKKKGVYGSDIKLNFHGGPVLAAMRSTFRVFDNNMFATAYITSSLIEAYEYGNAPKPSDETISLSVKAITGYHDNNFQEQPNTIMTFWPEVFNDTSATWESTPGNLLALFKMSDYIPWTFLEKMLSLFGFSEEATYIKEFLDERDTFIKAFKIPADFDDTFANLGLGSLLASYADDFPSAYTHWSQSNGNTDSLWRALKRFAYRPFSGNRDVNTIDPRSYYYLRGFLEYANQTGADVALIPTWVQDLEGNRNMSHRGFAMPFNVNNVDVTVCANAIFGITASVMSGLLVNDTGLTDPDIQKIYLSTSSMLVWEIENDFKGRRDLALTYYPSLFEFYWFISRTFALLERHIQLNASLPEMFETVRRNFGTVLRYHVTSVIMNETNEEGPDKVYFDDFLGDGDYTFHGKPLVRGEDRIFSTAMVVNTLVNTWTVFNYTTKQLRWAEGAPTNVTDTVKKASLWLTHNSLSGKYKPWNAFFSGSGKGYSSMPFWYPINRLEYLNGTEIPVNSSTFSGDDVILGMEGFVSEEKYQVLLNETHFGRRTPTEFKGYNYGNDTFPFWSSEAYTYATTVLALAQTNALMSGGPEYNVITNS